MTHFRVLVIGDDVDGQLAPFDENLEVPPHRVNVEGDDLRSMAEHYHTTDLHALAQHMQDWCSCDGYVDAAGLYKLSTSNEQAHWDWYDVGGRWSGMFVPVSRPCYPDKISPFRKQPFSPGQQPLRDGGVDALAICDWDRALHARLSAERARAAWDKWVHERQLPLRNRQAWVLPPEAEHQDDRDAFLAHYSQLYPFHAYVQHGVWTERGPAGWFGYTPTTQSDEEWDRIVGGILDALTPETLITLVDCHV